MKINKGNKEVLKNILRDKFNEYMNNVMEAENFEQDFPEKENLVLEFRVGYDEFKLAVIEQENALLKAMVEGLTSRLKGNNVTDTKTNNAGSKEA